MAKLEKYGEVPGVDKKIPRIVQGVIQVKVNEEDKGFALLDAAFERGITAIDTARIYGTSDRFIGKWMKARDNREQVTVLAKGSHHNDVRKRVTPYDIGTDLHDTLAHMQVEYVDLYVLHRDDPDYPVEPIVDALNQFVREGKIRAFGGSNWTAARLQEANDYAARSGQIGFAVSSPNFSLADQVKEPWADCISISGPRNEIERGWYARTRMPIFAWSSMAGGFWSGRFTRENIGDEHSDYFNKLVQQCYNSEDNFRRLDRVKELGERKGLTIPQVALAWVLNFPLNLFALVGSANETELDANVAAANLTLTAQEIDYLDLRADSPE
ncbi:MAG: aldo/keto reductase [Capsulimonadales bacterium]|nr:aldo/keto reductase [Capsulimonadales bacterium]